MTKISLITATLNNETTIDDCLHSVTIQTHQPYEHIIIDGLSTDSTLERIANRQNTRMKVIRESDRGIYDALNKGILQASGDIIGFLHADDMLYDEKSLSHIAERFKNPKLDAVYGDLIYVKKFEPKEIFRHWKDGAYSRQKLSHGWTPAHPTLYLKRTIYEALGSFDPQYKISGDYDFALRLFKNEKLSSEYIPTILYKMRLGGISNRAGKYRFTKYLEDYRAIKANDIGGIITVALKNLRKLKQIKSLQTTPNTRENQ